MSPLTKFIAYVGALGVLVLSGAAFASAAGTGSASRSSSASGYGFTATRAAGPGHAASAASSADTAKVTAAIKQRFPGATVERVETNAHGAAYEAHVVKADGTAVSVLLDKSFTITKTSSRPAGGGGNCPGGGTNDSGATGTSVPAPSDPALTLQ